MVDPVNQSITNLVNEMNDTHNPPKFGHVLSQIDEKMKDLKTTKVTPETRKYLKTALMGLSDRQEGKFSEKPFPRFSEFFERLGQLLMLRGFKTKQKYGYHLAGKIQRIQDKIWHKELTHFLEGDKSYNLSGMINEIKEMDSIKFQDFMKAIIETPATSAKDDKLGHKKLYILNKLDENRKEAFKDSGPVWHEKAYKILKGATKDEIRAFITDEQIDRLVSDPAPFLQMWEQHKNDPDFGPFAEILFSRTFKSCLKDANIAYGSEWMRIFRDNIDYCKKLIDYGDITKDEFIKVITKYSDIPVEELDELLKSSL